jgi:hypothetical protein
MIFCPPGYEEHPLVHQVLTLKRSPPLHNRVLRSRAACSVRVCFAVFLPLYAQRKAIKTPTKWSM